MLTGGNGPARAGVWIGMTRHFCVRWMVAASLVAAGCSSTGEADGGRVVVSVAAADTPSSALPTSTVSTSTPTPVAASVAGAAELANVQPEVTAGPSNGLLKARLSSPVTIRIGSDNLALDEVGFQRWRLDRSLAAGTAGQFVAVDGSSLRWYLDGEVTAEMTVPAGLTPVAASLDGNTIALTEAVDSSPASWPDGVIGPSQTSSTVVVANRSAPDDVRTFRLTGNFRPEALANFWVDGDVPWPASVFVLEYLPAVAPTHYRVRVMDTATGEIGLPLNLRDKSQIVDEQMNGISRTQVMSRNNGLLFTLYQGTDASGPYAFIHTLGLINGVWCIDLPAESGLASPGTTGVLALSPDESMLYVAASNGYLAELSTDVYDGLTVRRSVRVALPQTERPALAVSDTSIYFGTGDSIVELDRKSFEVTRHTEIAGPVAAFAADRTDGHLTAASPAAFYEFDGDLNPVAEVRPQVGGANIGSLLLDA